MTPDCVLLSVDLSPLVPVSMVLAVAAVWLGGIAHDAYKLHLGSKR